MTTTPHPHIQVLSVDATLRVDYPDADEFHIDGTLGTLELRKEVVTVEVYNAHAWHSVRIKETP